MIYQIYKYNFNKNTSKMHIIHKKNHTNNYYFNLEEVSISSITKLKKELTESALLNLV